MKYARSLYLLSLAAPPIFAACAAEAPSGPQVTIAAAALDYPGALDVCFGLTVYNGVPEAVGTDTVWSRDGICSTRYGNGPGGDISYVGPCDASAEGDNYVALTLESILVDDGGSGIPLDDQVTANGENGDGDADFENPCPATKRCILHFECVENTDVAVAFNLTVMRDAEQGFFDIAVNFEDVFCSAKVDSCEHLNDPIALLFGDDIHDAVGRDHTAVAAVACTAGPDDVGDDFDTVLLFTTKTVTCDGGVSFTLDPTDEPGGNLSVLSNDGTHTLRYAHYFGIEELSCGEMNATNSEGAILFACDGGICMITGLLPGRLPSSNGAAARAAGGYGGGYPGYGGQQQQQQQAGGFGAGAGAGPVPVRFFDSSGTEIFLEDGPDGPLLPEDWEVMSAPISCNKTYYNTAIDIENLAGHGLTNCALSFHATAIASEDDTSGFETVHGTFENVGGTYGAIHVDEVPLTGAATLGVVATICNAHPLNGDDLYDQPSHVNTQYVGTLADANPSFCFHSDDGAELAEYAGCGPEICPCWDLDAVVEMFHSVREDFTPLRFNVATFVAGSVGGFAISGQPGSEPDYAPISKASGYVDAAGFACGGSIESATGSDPRFAYPITKLQANACLAVVETLQALSDPCPCWDIDAATADLATIVGSASYVADFHHEDGVAKLNVYNPLGSAEDPHALRTAFELSATGCGGTLQASADATQVEQSHDGLNARRLAACTADFERLTNLARGCEGASTCDQEFRVERDASGCTETCTP